MWQVFKIKNINIKQLLGVKVLLLQLNIISGNTPQHIMMADENADREKKNPQPKLVSVTLNFISKKSIHPVENVLKRMMKSFKKQSKPCVINPKYSKPTSLPLYFYFGYQLLQESKCLDECAPVSQKYS